MIGKNIRRIRQEKGISQWQLSQSIGLRPGTIMLIEHGTTKPSKQVVKAIAKALEVPESEIYGGRG